MVGVMGWEVQLGNGRVGSDKQQEFLDMIDGAWRASLSYQGRQAETFRKTEFNFPVSGVEAVQQIFLEKLERLEKQKEAELIKSGRIPHVETFVLRYLKALVVRTCFKRPFRMTTGLTSFFYGYEFAQCFDVYDLLMQGRELEFKKERCPANWNEYLRTHMEYVRDRFGSFLAVEDESRWREFKLVREKSANVESGVRESLRLLEPWGSQDRLPVRFSKDDKSIPFFSEIKRSQLVRSDIGRARRRALLD